MLRQVVFVHKSSGTLIATDLIWNYPGSGTPKGTQAWKFGMDRVYRPFYNNLMIKDKGIVDDLVLVTCMPAHGVKISGQDCKVCSSELHAGKGCTSYSHLQLNHSASQNVVPI